MKRKNKDVRGIWKILVNRVDGKNKLLSPSKDMRVCSQHFIDEESTEENPYPTENLGYDARSRLENILQSSKRRRLNYQAGMSEAERFQVCSDSSSFESSTMQENQQEADKPDQEGSDSDMDIDIDVAANTESCECYTTDDDIAELVDIDVTANMESCDNDSVNTSNINEEAEKNLSDHITFGFSFIVIFLYSLLSLINLQKSLLILTCKVKRLE